MGFKNKFVSWLLNLFPVRQNPERTFYWFFEATCPVARDKGEASVVYHLLQSNLATQSDLSALDKLIKIALPLFSVTV